MIIGCEVRYLNFFNQYQNYVQQNVRFVTIFIFFCANLIQQLSFSSESENAAFVITSVHGKDLEYYKM